MIDKKIISRAALFLALLSFIISGAAPVALAIAASNAVNVWWPSNGAHMQGTQPFKAMVSGLDVSQYDMFWQVDGGTWNWMDNNYTDYQHKEASVDLSSWNWHGGGPYVVNFIARQGDTVIAQQSETIYVDNGQPTVTPTAPQPAPAQSGASTSTASPQIQISTPTQTQSSPSNSPQVSISAAAPIVMQSNVQAAGPQLLPPQPVYDSSFNPSNGSKFYVNPTSDAATQANEWNSGDATSKAAMQLLASEPTAVWFGNWNSNVGNDVHTTVAAAQAMGSVPVLVAYDIPGRDCGGYSSGGSNSPSGYTSWIQSFASGIGNAKAVVILEPDALAQMSCLSSADQATRLKLLSDAVSTLKNNPSTSVYLDAGHSSWIDAGTMAGDLQKANVARADGFSLNVSNFMPTSQEINYGQQISSQINGKHFVVDTSRNGNGSNGQWCNPNGMALGPKPTTQTGNSLVDAYLWIKTPGESDGNCNGGPGAGQWWPSYALELVQNAH